MGLLSLRTVAQVALLSLVAFVLNPLPEMVLVDRVDASTVKGKFMMGYQGWFACPGDGGPIRPGHHGWLHWFKRPFAEGGNPTFDLWPDMDELDDDERYDVPGLTLPSGQPAQLFSSRNAKTVRRHFRWLREHGLPGVFLQRFLSEVYQPEEGLRVVRDQVGRNVREAAEKEGRVWSVMWDLSGTPADKLEEALLEDWSHLVNEEQILKSPSYLREDGRPVVVVWGLGFADRGQDPTAMIRMIRRLKESVEDGLWLMAGTPTYWNRGIEDADPNPKFLDLWKEFDAISPWSVGRFGDERGADLFHKEKTVRDLKVLDMEDWDLPAKQKRSYVPVVFPGFSWKNLKEGPYNEIARQGGRFLWRQIWNAQKSGDREMMIYGAMLDEYDEATAFLPALRHTADIPNERDFLALDADGEDLPTDWYLRIAGIAQEALSNGMVVTEVLPKDVLHRRGPKGPLKR